MARRSGRLARYQQVAELHEQGVKPREIAPLVGLSDRTVRGWLKRGTFPEVRKQRKRQSHFDAFAPLRSFSLAAWREKWLGPVA
ncbi:helix-turn-helix domain-containing protein [Ktedonobacter robiniae]|uniref:Helix-turn-helix domain-containing protein n=1 Tax=Ktedonobacter robiniae TaxID=2778365 RepID=A0ABQ3UXM4_9CHLR|nr:helix-turn-helix domain-containing protein [Ktedonobacter robiniae]GHO57629.1 hypothetical protein KSB_61040 [Ktedonobacter robiniae]